MLRQTNQQSSVTGIILAGGGARRMGGQDKGLLPLHGKPMVAHVIARLRPQCKTLFINCNRNQDDYAAFGCPVIEDSLPGGLGPLAGLLTGMEHTETSLILSAPCDSPYLPDDLVPRMLATLQSSQAEICTVDDGQRLHPVILLARCTLRDNLYAYLQSGSRKVHDWFDSLPNCTADFSDQPAAFVNINSPHQLEDAERQ